MTLQLDLLKRNWCEEARAAIIRSIAPGDYFTSDELHDLYGITKPGHHNWWGVLLSGMKRMRLIDHCGYLRSKRDEANGRVVVLWRMR